MGFSVSAAHLVLLAASLAAAAGLAGAFLGAVDASREGHHAATRRDEAALRTTLAVVENATLPRYDAAAGRFFVRLENTGATVVAVSGLTHVVDGAAAAPADVAQAIEAHAASDHFLPGDALDVSIAAGAPPSSYRVMTAEGAVAAWRS